MASVYLEGARIIGSLIGLGQQFGGEMGHQFGGMGGDGSDEYYASMATSMGGDTVAIFGKKLATRIVTSMYNWRVDRNLGLTINAEDFRAAGRAADAICWAITFVDAVELTTGFGPPTQGDHLEAGCQNFSALHEQLKSALPDSSWQGSASQAYAAQDTILLDVAHAMADLDRKLAGLVKNQAEWVTHLRLALGIVKALLVAAYLVALAMIWMPGAGPVASRVFSITVCSLAMTTVAGMMGTVLVYSSENAKSADAIAGQYRTALESAQAVSAGSSSGARAADLPTIAGIGDPFERTSAQPSQPSVATSAGSMARKTASPTQRRTLDALIGDGARPASDVSASITASEEATPHGHGTPPLYGGSLATGQRPRTARTPSVKNPSWSAATVAPETNDDLTALTRDLNTGGAGPGADGGERAPIESGGSDAAVAESALHVEHGLNTDS